MRSVAAQGVTISVRPCALPPSIMAAHPAWSTWRRKSRSVYSEISENGEDGRFLCRKKRKILAALIWELGFLCPCLIYRQRHETFAKYCFNAGPAFQTLAQHWDNIGPSFWYLLGRIAYTDDVSAEMGDFWEIQSPHPVFFIRKTLY